ncbi:MAG: DM13 domain-containing protein [Gemmatimonadaceae bacterium]|nr:DM13 domain-containing protein [Gloeobacterales cyanobacterium ES-bin-141]
MKNARLAIALAILLGADALYLPTAPPVVAQSAMSGTTPGAMEGGNTTQAKAFINNHGKSTGTGRLMTKGGKTYIELSKDFTLDEAPDIYVTLYRDAVPPEKTYKADKYVNIARLKSRKGSQSYLVPASVKLDDYQSIAIWCKKFDVTLAYALLEQ